MKRFLIIDDNADGRSLLNRTLMRKFPQALVTECQDGQAAAFCAAHERFDAILVHRAGEMDQESMILAVRAVAPDAFILALSGYDRSERALAAGANAFLNYDKWLMVGTVIDELLKKHSRRAVAGEMT